MLDLFATQRRGGENICRVDQNVWIHHIWPCTWWIPCTVYMVLANTEHLQYAMTYYWTLSWQFRIDINTLLLSSAPHAPTNIPRNIAAAASQEAASGEAELVAPGPCQHTKPTPTIRQSTGKSSHGSINSCCSCHDESQSCTILWFDLPWACVRVCLCLCLCVCLCLWRKDEHACICTKKM